MVQQSVDIAIIHPNSAVARFYVNHAIDGAGSSYSTATMQVHTTTRTEAVLGFVKEVDSRWVILALDYRDPLRIRVVGRDEVEKNGEGLKSFG